MHLAISLASVLLALSPYVSAISYNAFSSSNSCSGSSFGCSDGGGVCCGGWPAAYGYSANFVNLQAGTQGQGYTDNCVSFRFAVYGPGTQCWKSGGNGRVKSTNWFHSQSKRRRGVEGEGSEECSPQFFSYPDADGTYHQISVSSASEAEIIADHYAAENFTALTKFKRHLI